MIWGGTTLGKNKGARAWKGLLKHKQFAGQYACLAVA